MDVDLAQIHSESLQAAYTGIFPKETMDTTCSLDRIREGFTRELIAKTPITLIAFWMKNHWVYCHKKLKKQGK